MKRLDKLDKLDKPGQNINRSNRYTLEEKNKAYLAYRETRSLYAASKLTGVRYATLDKWKNIYNWETRLKNDDKSLAMQVIDQKKDVAKVKNVFGLSESDAELLFQIKKIEAVCFLVIEKQDEDAIGRLGLKPESFDQAMKALKVCWDTRDKIFNKFAIRGNSSDQPHKINYVAAVHQHFGGTVESSAIEKAEVVSRRTIDIKH